MVVGLCRASPTVAEHRETAPHGFWTTCQNSYRRSSLGTVSHLSPMRTEGRAPTAGINVINTTIRPKITTQPFRTGEGGAEADGPTTGPCGALLA